jgi:hypothetical protein
MLVLTLLVAMAAHGQTTIFSDDFNRASLGGSYTISQGGGGGTAFIVGNSTLWLTNGTPAGWVSVATNLAAGNGFSPTLDSCNGVLTWTFNMRFGRTGNTPSGFTSGSYGNGYVLAADNQDFSSLGSKGYAVLFGNGSSPDTFRLVAYTNGIRTDYTASGSAAGNALIVGTGAFAVTTQAAANDYYSFKVTYDPATRIWTLYGRDDGSGGFADPASGSFTTIGTFTESTAIYRTLALGRTGAYWSHSTGANNPSQFDNFKVTLTPAGPSVTIDNTGTPAAGSVVVGTVDVPVFGFGLTPADGTTDFTALNVTTTGTASVSDLSNFRLIYDADNSGTYNGGDSIVSGSGVALGNPLSLTISGQTGFSAARRYLLVADVAGAATIGATFTASIAAPADITTTSTAIGSAVGNQQTIVSAPNDLIMAGGGEPATISSLINDATITTVSQGAAVWQVTFSNAVGNAGAANISAMTFKQGPANQVTNWNNVIQAAELFDGATALASGAVSSNSIFFSGIAVAIPDGASDSLTLRISLKSTAGALTDNSHFHFTLLGANVTVSGNGLTTATISSDQTKNQIAVVATKLVLLGVPALVVVNQPFTVGVQARDANDNLDLDDSTSVAITRIAGSGTLGGGDALILSSGFQRWSLQYSTAETFMIQAAGGSLVSITSGSIVAAAKTLAISGYMANPAGTDSPYEYVQLKALQAVDFSATPVSIVWANNGTATGNGWVEGSSITYKFNVTSGTLVAGDVAYVGGTGKLINGSGSGDISAQSWLRTIDTSTGAGDGLGVANSAGVMGNGGANADGIAVFIGTSLTDTSVPIDAVFYGAAIGTAVVSAGADGYTLPYNDLYNGGFLKSTNPIFFDPASGAYVRLTGTYNTNSLQWIVPRTASSVAGPTNIADVASGITLVGTAISNAGPAQILVPSNGVVSIKFFGVPNNQYVVRTATNLAGLWWPLSTNTAGNDGSWVFTAPNATNLQQYYRLAIP